MKPDPERDDQLPARLRAYAERLDAASAAAPGPVVAASHRAAADGRRRAWMAGTAVAAALAGVAVIAWSLDGDDGRPRPDRVIAVSPAAVSPAAVSPAAVSPAAVSPADATATTDASVVTTATTPWPTATLPDLFGQEASGAGLVVDGLGLKPIIEPVSDPTAPPGTVVHTTPGAGSILAHGSLVRVAVSTGPDGSGLMIDAVGHVVRDVVPTDAVPSSPPPDQIAGGAVDDRGYLGRIAGTDLLVRRFEVRDLSNRLKEATCVYIEAPTSHPGSDVGTCWPSGSPPRYHTIGDDADAVTIVAAEPDDAMVALENGARMELTHPIDGFAVFLESAFSAADGPLGACWFGADGQVNRTESPIHG